MYFKLLRDYSSWSFHVVLNLASIYLYLSKLNHKQIIQRVKRTTKRWAQAGLLIWMISWLWSADEWVTFSIAASQWYDEESEICIVVCVEHILLIYIFSCNHYRIKMLVHYLKYRYWKIYIYKIGRIYE